jgi:NADP-dependent 3-hydroxy acid dehydrogenase YdfG
MDDWQWVFDIDLMGVVRGSHHFISQLRSEAESGRTAHLINIASFAGFAAMPGLSAYGTAKAAVVSFSEHLLTELDGTGIGVSVICPSFVSTNLLETFRSTDPAAQKTVERWMKHSPVTAEDVANCVFDAMCQKKFLVLTHPKTHWVMRLKKFFPKRYYRRISEMGRLAREGSK